MKYWYRTKYEHAIKLGVGSFFKIEIAVIHVTKFTSGKRRINIRYPNADPDHEGVKSAKLGRK
jgi:hypothetical protein